MLGFVHTITGDADLTCSSIPSVLLFISFDGGLLSVDAIEGQPTEDLP
jgi:hypothetical protein